MKWIKCNLLCLHISFIDLFTTNALFAIITFLLVKIKLTAHMGVRSTRVGDGVGCKRQNVSHNISLGSRVWKKEFSIVCQTLSTFLFFGIKTALLLLNVHRLAHSNHRFNTHAYYLTTGTCLRTLKHQFI